MKRSVKRSFRIKESDLERRRAQLERAEAGEDELTPSEIRRQEKMLLLRKFVNSIFSKGKRELR